ncbi:MAG: response regulator transcription factor [Actinomycetaceae bacterium]|nr:response regulator transcription factor [Actinomycetaceae bacterium]
MNMPGPASSKAPYGSTLIREDGTPLRVMVVDDEVMLAELLAQVLMRNGWDTRTAADGYAAIRLAEKFQPDVVVLDVMMPKMDGFEVLERLRKTQPYLPVLFLTALDSVEDRVMGLRAGGDDYVTKPYSLEEVMARLEALARRAGFQSEQPDAILTVGDLEMNENSHEVSRAGQPINLTKTEFELLRYLMENPNRVLSKAQILDRVWSYDFGGQANVVELYISYLRKKVDSGQEPMIHTMRGVGYILKPATSTTTFENISEDDTVETAPESTPAAVTNPDEVILP